MNFFTAVFIAAALAMTSASAVAQDRAKTTGKVLDFKVIAARDGTAGNAPGGKVLDVEVDPKAGAPDDFEVTAVAIASVVLADPVAVNVFRSDIKPKPGEGWQRRMLARAEYWSQDQPQWMVFSRNHVPNRELVFAADDLEAEALRAFRRGGFEDGEEDAVVRRIVKKRRLKIDPKESDRPFPSGFVQAPVSDTGSRDHWGALPGPGSEHVAKLLACFQGAIGSADAWKLCK